MRYSTTIDNSTSLRWGLNIQEAYLFALIFEANSWADKILLDEEIYFFLSRNKVISEIPLLTDKPDTIYRFYKKLAELDLIKYKRNGYQDCILLTKKGKEWNNSKAIIEVGKKSESVENNPNEVGKFSESGTEKNPTYNNTNNYTITSNKENSVFIEIEDKKTPTLSGAHKEKFDIFWNLYLTKESKQQCEKKWSKLNLKEMDLAIADVPKYEATRPAWQNRKNPLTYINNKSWNDRIEQEAINKVNLSDPILKEREDRRLSFEQRTNGMPHLKGAPMTFHPKVSIYHVEIGMYDQLK